MPVRDLRGEEIPAGKVRRRLAYDALADDGSPDWMTLAGEDASERTTDIAAGRGELELTVTDGVGGYALPPVDPDSFREVRLGVALHDGLSEGNRVALGFTDAVEEPANAVRLEQPSSSEELRPARMVHLDDGDRSERDNLGSIVGALDRVDTDVCAWVEVRMRPAERGETVVFGGAGRGDVHHEAAGQPYGVATPMHPLIRIDTTPAGTADTVGLAKVWFEVLHN